MTKDVVAHPSSAEDTVWGMPRAEYHAKAQTEAKGNIILWLISGLVFNLFTGKLVSLKSFLLFLPGIFVVALAGIPFLYLSVKTKQRVQRLDELDQMTIGHLPASKQVPTLVVATLWQIITFAFPIVASVIYVSVV